MDTDEFEAAMNRLGVRIEAPFAFTFEGELFTCSAHLPDFGGPGGMVVHVGEFDASIWEEKGLESRFGGAAKECGYYYSMMNSVAEQTDDDIKEALSDWGYFGPSEFKPGWYRVG